MNLEDISAPRCFELERRLIEALDCPVMHDDQHGTAIIVLAALRGANTVLDRSDRRPSGSSSPAPARPASPARTSCCRPAPGDVAVLDSRGIIHDGPRRAEPGQGRARRRAPTRGGLRGGLAEALDGADVFVGLSGSTRARGR